MRAPLHLRLSMRLALASLCFALTLAGVGCSGRAARPPAPDVDEPRTPPREEKPRAAEEPPAEDEPLIHVVAPGENLFRIAKRYGVPLDLLAEANGIADPARIDVGQRLVIPGGSAAARPGVDGNWTWPVVGRVSSLFGAPRPNRTHRGIDILVPHGTPVLAARGGEVRFAGTLSGYGRLVVIEHDEGLASWYAHNRRLLVREGELVALGEVVAESGASGNATAPHLHFEIRREESPLDPLALLPPR